MRILAALLALVAFQAEAAISIAVSRTATNTGTGNQSFTAGSTGATIQGAMLIVTSATADDTATNNATLSFGFTDCVNHRTVGVGSTFGGFDGDNERLAYDNGTILAMTRGTSLRGVATFVSCDTDGITINWTTAPSAAYLLTLIAFGGADMDVAVSSLTHANPSSSPTTPWEPDVVFGASTGKSFDELPTTDAILSFGYAANGASISQGTMGWSSDNTNPTALSAIIDDDDWFSEIGVSSTTVTNGAEITAFGATSFTSTLTAGTGFPFMYLALNFNGVATAQVTPFSSPGATAGNNVVSGLDVDPDYVFTILSMLAAYDTGADDVTAGAMGVSFFNASASFSNSISDEDAEMSNTDTSSRVDDRAINLSDDDGVLMYAASLTSLDADGWTLNYATEADSADRAWLALAIGPAASGGGGGTVVNPITGRGGAAAQPIVVH